MFTLAMPATSVVVFADSSSSIQVLELANDGDCNLHGLMMTSDDQTQFNNHPSIDDRMLGSLTRTMFSDAADASSALRPMTQDVAGIEVRTIDLVLQPAVVFDDGIVLTIDCHLVAPRETTWLWSSLTSSHGVDDADHPRLQTMPRQLAPRRLAPSPFAPLPFAPLPLAPSPFAPLPFAPLPFAPLQFAPLPFAPLPFAPLQFAPLPFAMLNSPPAPPSSSSTAARVDRDYPGVCVYTLESLHPSLPKPLGLGLGDLIRGPLDAAACGPWTIG